MPLALRILDSVVKSWTRSRIRIVGAKSSRSESVSNLPARQNPTTSWNDAVQGGSDRRIERAASADFKVKRILCDNLVGYIITS